MTGGRPVAIAGMILVGVTLLAGCSTSSSTATSTTSTTAAAPTTTTLTPTQSAVLGPKMLTVADFPAGWKKDTAADAASVKGTPACIGNMVVVKGSSYRTTAVFVGPAPAGKTRLVVAPAAIQTVAGFAPGAVTGAVGQLQRNFESCNGLNLSQKGQTVHVATAPVAVSSTGPGGFAEQMVITLNKVSVYIDAFVGVAGDFATSVVWRSSSPSTALFEQTSAKALAKL